MTNLPTIIDPATSQPSEWLKLFVGISNVCLGFVLGLFAAEFSRRRTLRQERKAAKEKRMTAFGYFMTGLRAEVGEQQYRAQPQTLCPRYAQMRVEIQREAFLLRGDFGGQFQDLVRAAVALNDAEAGTHIGIQRIQKAFDEIISYTNSAVR